MPGKIKILPEILTHRIAAGEVVERPASIVKELVENSLDAGATELTIELEKGGSGSILVTDNGEGLYPEDVPLAFFRHATSKISSFDDLYGVRSFGFRGEALPSIASIARVEITTRRKENQAGLKMTIEAGEVKEKTETGCREGASIHVSRIFEAVPVRRKFLKGDMTEQGYCLDWITRLALARPEIRIDVSADGKKKLSIPAARDLSERIALTMGQDFRNQLVPAAGEKNGSSLQGYVSRPEFTRSSSAQLYVFVNGRFVKDAFLSHAVMTAYRRIIEPRRYPMVVIFIDVPVGEADVNVHPTKMEVRFRNPREIYGLVVEALGAAIGVGFAGAKDDPSVYRQGDGGEGLPSSGDSYHTRVAEALKRYRIGSGPQKLFFGAPPAGKTKPDLSEGINPAFSPAAHPLRENFDAAASTTTRDNLEETGPEAKDACPGHFAELRYLGQVGGTYLLFEDQEGLAIIDQHAAHERVLFEKMRRQAVRANEAGKEEPEVPKGQRLLLPEVVSLPPRELSFLVDSIPILAEIGMEVELFGRDSIVVKATPAFLSDADARTLVFDLLAEFDGVDQKLPLTEKRDKIFASLSCRAAVKANHRLNIAEVESLCRELDGFPGIATCPHGRPLKITLSRSSLEKMFKRR